MGLLVAGVTGGASLIKSAKIRSVCTDYLNYKNAYNAYYTQFGERAGTENDVFNVNKTFKQLVDKGIVDGTNFNKTRNVMEVSKLKDKDAKFTFSGKNIFQVFAELFAGDDVVLLSLWYVSAQESKSILQKLDNGKGDSGNILVVNGAGGGGELCADPEQDEKDVRDGNNPNGYDLFMKMDF